MLFEKRCPQLITMGIIILVPILCETSIAQEGKDITEFTIYVNADPNTNPIDCNRVCTSLEDAVSDTNDPLKVILADGIYSLVNAIVVEDKNLTIESRNGANGCIIDCDRIESSPAFRFGPAGEATIRGITIRNAKSGAIDVNGASANIHRCRLIYNQAQANGGAVNITNCIGGLSVDIDKCLFYANTAENGGAIACYTSNVTITNCTFYENHANQNGGAVYSNGATGKTTLKQSVCNYNTAYNTGGAIHLSGKGELVNNVLTCNAAIDGGGLYYDVGAVEVINCTFSANEATSGGGIKKGTEGQPIKIVNSILWGNRTTDADPNDAESQIHGTANIAYSNIEGLLSETGLWRHSEGIDFGGNQSLDPYFAFEDDPKLMHDSPCIDVGCDLADLPIDIETDIPTKDLTGISHSAQGIDMGAYEYDPNHPGLAFSPRVVQSRGVHGRIPIEPQLVEFRDCGARDGIADDITDPVVTVSEISLLRGSRDRLTSWTLEIGSETSPGRYLAMIDIQEPNSLPESQPLVIEFIVGQVHRIVNDVSKTNEIEVAVRAAGDGDIIELSDSTDWVVDNDFIIKHAVTICSANNDPCNCIINCSGMDYGFSLQGHRTQGSVFRGLTIKSAESAGINCSKGSIVADNCVFEDCSTGIHLQPADARITHCKFLHTVSANSGTDAVRVNYDGKDTYESDVRVYDCNFVNQGLTLFSSQHIRVNECDFTNTTIEDANSAKASLLNCSLKSTNVSFVDTDDGTLSNCEFLDLQNKSYAVKFNGVTNGRVSRSSLIGGDASEAGLGVNNSKVDVVSSIFCRFEKGITCDMGSDVKITHCTFSGNSLYDIYADSSAASLRLFNSILWSDQPLNKPEKCEAHYCSMNYESSDFDNLSQNDNCGRYEPSFQNEKNQDFRLVVDSNCIDKGKSIEGVYSDRRGSLRPINGDDTPTRMARCNDMDIGAYEYSVYFGGAENEPIGAFEKVHIPAFGRVGTVCEVSWTNSAAFPNDNRVNQPGRYRVLLSLVSEDGLDHIPLKETWVSADMPPEGKYNTEIKLGPEYVGRWKLRISLTEDLEQYTESKEICYIAAREPKICVIGTAVEWHPKADKTERPVVQDDFKEAFFWSDHAHTLYATRPVAGCLITWTDRNGDDIPQLITNKPPEVMQKHITAPPPVPPVELLPEGSKYSFVEIMYTSNDATLVKDSQLTTDDKEGKTVLLYGTNSQYKFDPEFVVVDTRRWADPNSGFQKGIRWDIGKEVEDPSHDKSKCGAGYVLHEISPYDASIYDRQSRSGQIIPVNRDDPGTPEDNMVVFWYQFDEKFQVQWPVKAVDYDLRWPVRAEKIVIASQLGSEVNAQEPFNDDIKNLQIYSQPDRALPGFNPNEEHAALFDSYKEPTRRKAAFALRDDLNRTEWRIGPDSRKLKYTSKPYVLVKYQVKNADNDDWIWEFRVFDVERSTSTYPFTYCEKAGKRLLPPYPLSRLALQGASYPEDNSGDSFSTTYSIYSEPGIHGPFFVDYNHDIWTRCAGEGNVRWFYPLQEEFWYDLDGDGENDLPPATPLPWLSFIEADEPETPIAVKHEILWPDDDIWSSEDRENVPVLFVGETLLEPRRGLPDILNQSSVQILFDNAAETEQQTSSDSLVRLYDPLSERRVALPALPVNQLDLRTDPRGNKIILDLPFHLQTRCFYDAKSEELVFRGYYSNQGVGDPILLPNVMSVSDKNSLLSPRRDFSDAQFENAVSELHGIALDRFMNQGKKRRLGPGPKALSAGAATGEGYVTLGFSTDEPNCAPLPVALEVIRVEYPLYRGEVKVIQPDNVFDERLTLRHSSDFGCEPEKWYLEWQYCQQLEQPGSPGQDPNNHWKLWDGDETGGKDVGLVQLTIRGDAIWALKDMWFSCRYRRITDHDDTPNAWSNWTAPQLHESWVKRVVRAINPYDQRVKDFHTAEVHSQVDMIGQAGPPFSGNIALTNNPSNINNKGLIEVYSTLLDRASSFSLDRGEYREDIGVSNTLLLASSRVADLYMLLGNEAYADAVDPTIGFGGTGGDHSVTAPSLFCFQNQLGTLIEEELTLLRGLDKTYPYPLYNRLAWNFASGEGEVAYVLNYNISDQDGTGDVDEYDARQMYPQGHGDAWGHYLTAIKTYYDLLRDSDFTWIPRIEAVVVAQVPVEVDYLDERKFARIAAAKARTGAEIVDLTYRQTYSQDVVKRLSGYADADQDRAWGVSEWGRRAGQGAYFDWVVANAILPAQDPNEFSIKKIDRTTVLELREIVSCFNDIQTQMDKADLGLNPVGVARDVVPFDINPSELVDAQGQPTGRTHFEQIFDRAVQALSNSLAAFNLADRNTQQLRQQQDNLERFRNDIANQEAELEGRLIEVFGYPYGDDIGPTGTYPEGYDGPDLYHFDYVDVSELLGRSPVTAETFSVNLNNVEVDDNGQLHEQPQTVTFNLSKDGLGLIKPTSWSRPRRAPGELQFARSDLLQARARFQKALLDYDSLIQQIRDQAKLLQAQYDLNDEEIRILNRVHNRQSSLNEAIKGARERQLRYRTQGRIATLISNAMAEALPTAAGLSNDVTAPLRSVIRLAGVYVNEERTQAADEVSLHELDLQQSKEIVQSASNIELTELRSEHGAKQQLAQLEQLIRSEASLQLELFTIQESMQQASSRYVAALARGERILQDRLRFRKQTAANIQDYRYKDMAFRVFRTDAVSKYRAQFDMAALYVLLAAKAYDYETCLASTDGLAGTYLIDKICRQRTIGQIDQGIPIPGRGLAGILAELRQNFDLLKGQLGFNNPQVETNYFSLRNERFRIIEDSTNNSWRDISNSEWLDTLASHKKNMWQVEDCRRFCKPFSDESEEPSIVLEFETRIDSGQNFFGKPLGADAYYAPENFATKIRSVGIWFSNYDTTVMSPTPRVYLIPVGEDRMRAPSGDVSEVRCWQIREQAIPEPFPIQAQDYFQLTPMESLSDYYGAIRRHGRLRAYPDGGFNVSEMTYNSRLVGRSVWNTKWLLVIPGSSLWHDADEGIERFIHGVTDIRLFFKTYAYPGY